MRSYDKKLHPSQHRTLSLHEAMILHTISNYDFKWKRADGKKVSDKLIRELIGESIPPAGLEKIFTHLLAIMNDNIAMSPLPLPIPQQLALFSY